MNQPLRTSSALSLVILSSMIAGCAAPHARMGAASQANSKAAADAGLGMRAIAALNSNNIPMAIDFAEKAVAKTPGDAGLRALLGNAYFAGGRFQSAEAAFRDSLTLDANQPRVALKYALVEIALGKNAQATSFLAASRGLLDPSDYGLALALAGHTSQAIAVLDAAARQTGADATVRQNLALAHGLAGEWDQAKIIASQDVPGGQLDARIHQWMQLASPTHASDQVAALVGVVPATVDAGQPVQLALNKVDAPVKLATAPIPAPQAAKAAPVSAPIVRAAATLPAPAPIAAVAPATPLMRPSLATLAATAVAEAKAVLASVIPQVSIAQPAKAPAPRRSAAAPRAAGKSPTVVQLGAYGSPERVLTAWNGAARKYGALKAYAPMSARFSSPKGTFYRLSVQGFHSLGEANSLCNSLRSQGGSCFVRNVAGDSPVKYAAR